MPLIPIVGKRNSLYRAVLGVTYLLLVLGGLTMIGPFWVMLVKSVSSGFDVEANQWWPRYLSDPGQVLANYEGELHGDLETVLTEWNLPPLTGGWKQFQPPMPDFSDATLRRQVVTMQKDWLEFRRALVLSDEGIRFTGFSPFGSGAEAWRTFLKERYGSLAAASDAHGFPTDKEPPLLNEVFPLRLIPEDDVSIRDAREFRRKVCSSDTLANQITVRFFDNEFRSFLRRKHTDTSAAVEQVFFHDSPPTGAPQQADWLQFVQHGLPVTLITFEAGSVSPRFPVDADRQNDWVDFLARCTNPTALHVRTADSLRAEWLRTRYAGQIANLNEAWGTTYPDFASARFDVARIDALFVHEHLTSLRWRYFASNYATVFSFLVTKGDATLNTLILVGLSLVATFTVNPLAAYALSRFRLRGEQKILIFMIATLAFPAEVAMIPSFTLIRLTGLLNTYWALVLPGLANGMGILLLKGFFDSLPKELYEAAQMDGAGELRMFWQVTLPLSSPIMAVNALAAFVAAYTGWGWALLICQDSSMWTIMVHLFQFQVTASHQGQVFASLVIGSIPTLLVFLFCQRIIMRGIVLPTLK